MGLKLLSFDVYEHRGAALKEILVSFLSKGNISAITYSNPNNPGWFCFTEEELQIIGELATEYNTIVIEDLAYFLMDFRKDLKHPFQPPYQPTVARYTENYVIHLSGSKIFSYAGQRIAIAAISNKLYSQTFPGLTSRYDRPFGSVYINIILYSLSSGTSHSAQYALAAMFKASSDGTYDFVEVVSEYGKRAKKMKSIFCANNFYVVYKKDIDEPIADGFYFTINYPGMTSGELMQELLCYGISAIPLLSTGSKQQGLRACTSFIKEHQFSVLEERLTKFKEAHPVK